MLGQVSSHIYRRGVRHSRFSTSTNKDLDELLWSQSAFGRLKNMVKLLVSSQERNFFQGLKEQLLDKVPLKSLFTFQLYCELKNPVVEKYKFNYEEFLGGARESGIQVFDALIDPEFRNYVHSGDGKKPECVQYIESVSSPIFFNICKDAFDLMREQNMWSNLKSMKIGRNCLLKVEAECRDKALDSDRSHVVQLNSKIVSATLVNVLGHPHSVVVPPRNVAKELFTVPEMSSQHIPYHGIPGVDDSVLLTLDVYYDAQLTYGGVIKQEDSPSPVVVGTDSIESNPTLEPPWNEEHMKNITARLTFHGCISGQTDLEWKVVSIGFR